MSYCIKQDRIKELLISTITITLLTKQWPICRQIPYYSICLKSVGFNLAYTIVWTYTHPTYGMRKSIEIATILGSRGYFVDYTAATANFSKFLPVAEKMIESFQKTK